MNEGGDISQKMSGFVKDQMAANREKKLKKAQAAKAGGTTRIIMGVVSVILIAVAGYFLYVRMQPPGFVRILDVTESPGNGVMTVSGKVRNVSSKAVDQRTWVISYVDADKKPVTETNLVVKDLKPGETKNWSVDVPNWRPGLRLMPVKKKEE